MVQITERLLNENFSCQNILQQSKFNCRRCIKEMINSIKCIFTGNQCRGKTELYINRIEENN